MFVLKKQNDVLWPCTVSYPVDGGVFKEEKISIRIKLLPAKGFQALIKQADDGLFIRDILLGWEGVADDDGKALEFSEQTRDALAQVPYFVRAVINAYAEASVGALAKN